MGWDAKRKTDELIEKRSFEEKLFSKNVLVCRKDVENICSVSVYDHISLNTHTHTPTSLPTSTNDKKHFDVIFRNRRNKAYTVQSILWPQQKKKTTYLIHIPKFSVIMEPSDYPPFVRVAVKLANERIIEIGCVCV